MAGISPHLKTSGERKEFTERVAFRSMGEDVTEEFQNLKLRRRHKYLIFFIDDDGTTHVDKIGARNSNFEAFKNDLPFTACRYAIYDHEFTTHDGRITNKLFFLSWLPNNSTPQAKMAYTHAKVQVREYLDGVFDQMASSIDDIATCFGIDEEDEEDEDSDFDF